MLREELRQIDSSSAALRKFGLMVGGVLLALGLVLMARQRPSGPWLAGGGGALVLLGLLAPGCLRPLQRPWMMLAVLLGAVVSPVVLGIIYYGVFTPIGLLARLRGRDFLQRRRLPDAPSYWMPREAPPGGSRYERQG